MKHNPLSEIVGFIVLPVGWSWNGKMKFHSTACKISIQVDNISYCVASLESRFVLQLLPNA